MKKLFFAVFLLLFITVNVQAQTPYYQGKTIRIVTGFPAGDVNDTWPRLIGQHSGAGFLVARFALARPRTLTAAQTAELGTGLLTQARPSPTVLFQSPR